MQRQLAIVYGSLVYSLIGIYFLRKVLLKFFNEKVSTSVLILVVLGTNYYHIAGFSYTMSHNYIFTLYAVLLYCVVCWHEKPKIRFIVWAAVTAGLYLSR